MAGRIERVKNLSMYENWPECFCCEEPMEIGYGLYPDDKQSIQVCDNCLAKSRRSKSRWIGDGKVLFM